MLRDRLLSPKGNVFGDPYFNYVKLLLPCQGANNGTTFTDKSTSAKTVTVGGNSKTVTSITDPFGNPSGVLYLDGTGDYLQLADSDDWYFGTNDWTIEFWGHSLVNDAGILMGQYSGASQPTWQLSLGGGSAYIQVAAGSGVPYNVCSTYYKTDTNQADWKFITVRCSYPILTVYVGTTLIGTTTLSGAMPNSSFSFIIGCSTGYVSGISGYLSNIRVTKGVARPVEVPIAPFPTQFGGTVGDPYFANVELLVNAYNSAIADIGPKQYALTVGGNAAKSSAQPLYGKDTIIFDGTGDYIRPVSTLSDFDFLTNHTMDFTVEAIFRVASLANYSGIIMYGNNGGGSPCFQIVVYPDGRVYVAFVKNAIQEYYQSATGTISVGVWYYLFVSYTHATKRLKVFLNNVSVEDKSLTQTFNGSVSNTTQLLTVGSYTAFDSNVFSLNGNISAVRITKGVARPFQVLTTAYTVEKMYKGIVAYGYNGTSYVSMSNLLSNTGVFATDVTGVGTARNAGTGSRYGLDKGIFVFGSNSSVKASIANLVSNTGVISSDSSTVANAKDGVTSTGYSSDKAIAAYGHDGSTFNQGSNLISSTGVLASTVGTVGTGRARVGGVRYSVDKGIFAYGHTSVDCNMSNLVSNTGVISSDTSGVGTARSYMQATSYGGDKAIFAFGYSVGSSSYLAMSNLVSNTGVISSDTTGVGTVSQARVGLAYGVNTGVFAYGATIGAVGVNYKNFVSNTGVIASDTSNVGTTRWGPMGSGYGA